MTTALDWRPYFQSGCFSRQQVELIRSLLQAYSESVDAAAAPTNATYVVMSLNGSLTTERTWVWL